MGEIEPKANEVARSQVCLKPSAARWLKTTTHGRGRPVHPPERIIGIVRLMEVKELRGATWLQVWHGTCSAVNRPIPL